MSKNDKTELNETDSAPPKGKVKLEPDGKGLAVHVDRQGFRRLLQTLERLAATGESQTFEKSGRWPKRIEGQQPERLEKIVFHIEDGS